MTHPVKLSFFMLFLVFFSGCGQVELPQDEQKGETILLTQPQSQASPETSDASQPNDALETSDDSSLLATKLKACEEENSTFSEALELNTKALESCESEKKRFSSQLSVASQDSQKTDRYRKFVQFYLQNTQPAEFLFPKCGTMQTLMGESWFSDFKSALTLAQIPFGQKIVETADLTGGCASAEGNMAFFLGAETDALSEFHLLKYDFQSKTIEEAFLVDGTCTACPNELGKRNGNYLTLFGNNNGTKVEYRYYYADNILAATK